MKTNITQRLIAAGASPERARAFETQFTAARPGAKKKDIQDAFDKELAAASAALFPTTFKPPKASDADFDAYASLVLGQPAIDLAVKRAAPNYTSAERTYAEKDSEDFTFPEFIVNEIKMGTPLDEAIAVGTSAGIKFGLKSDTAKKQIEDFYAEYAKIPQAKETLLNANKYYAAGLPDPKLTYGAKTDFTAGEIDFRTNPAVSRIFSSPKVTRAKQLSQVAPAGYMKGSEKEFSEMRSGFGDIEKDVFNKFLNTGATPFRDEVKIRQTLKGKKLG
jgi:hypothetical protein